MVNNNILEINLIDDIKKIIINDITNMGYTINSKQNTDLLLLYFNLKKRLVEKKTRSIKKSKEFCCPLYLNQGLKNLENKIKNGESIWQHLSRKIICLDYNDKMLYDWGIYHLHLGINYNKNNLVNGTKEILFAMFDDKTAYFIQIYDHQQWTNKDVLNIIENNWPHLICNSEIPGNVDVEYEFNNDDIKELRNANINPIIKLDSGKCYIPIGGGVTANGGSLEALDQKIDLINLLEEQEKKINQYLNKLHVTNAKYTMDRLDNKSLRIESKTISYCWDMEFPNLASTY